MSNLGKVSSHYQQTLLVILAINVCMNLAMVKYFLLNQIIMQSQQHEYHWKVGFSKCRNSEVLSFMCFFMHLKQFDSSA